MLTVKSRSIDVSEKPETVYKEQVQILEKAEYIIHDIIVLDPFEKDHAMILASSV